MLHHGIKKHFCFVLLSILRTLRFHREDTSSRHKKQMDLFCSALDFTYLCNQN